MTRFLFHSEWICAAAGAYDSLATTLSIIYRLEAIFARLDPMPSHILLGMLAQDSTIVYYKVARGIVKPIN